jgi:hypothetical protein
MLQHIFAGNNQLLTGSALLNELDHKTKNNEKNNYTYCSSYDAVGRYGTNKLETR